jgi:VWFA-related protein
MLGLVLSLAAGAGAQNPASRPRQTGQQNPPPKPPPDQGEDEVIRVTSNLVVVPVSVTDTQGQPVQGLTIPDFRLEEENRPQEIAEIGDPDQVPIELALLLDVSGSVRERFSFEQQAASRFLKQVLKPADRATIYAIDTEPRLEQTRANADQASAKLMGIAPSNAATAFYDTVVEAANYLKSSTPPQHRRVIIAISDGEDTFSDKHKTVASALPEVQRADTIFYSINPSGQALKLNLISTRGQSGMEQLAAQTGGYAFVPDVLEDLNKIFDQIAAELRSQYLLQYYSKSEAARGKFLSIKVSVPKRPELRIRARQGYYAPGK